MKKEPLLEHYLETLNIKHINTLEEITAFLQAHQRTYTFSSFKVLLKEEVNLNLDAIYESLVLKRRGGYCFEHNKLIYETLKFKGFDVKYFLARVVNNLIGDEPQTHRFTLLSYKGQAYIIDVGLGFRSPTQPIAFTATPTQTNLNQTYWVENFNDKSFGLMLEEKNNPFRITRFDLGYCNEGDFEMGNFYSYCHPKAVFVNNLVLSRIDEETIYSLRNNHYLKLNKSGQEKVPIRDKEHFKQIINEDFNLNFTDFEINDIFEDYVLNNK